MSESKGGGEKKKSNDQWLYFFHLFSREKEKNSNESRNQYSEFSTHFIKR